jgi:hypothetical protein
LSPRKKGIKKGVTWHEDTLETKTVTMTTSKSHKSNLTKINQAKIRLPKEELDPLVDKLAEELVEKKIPKIGCLCDWYIWF